MCLENYLHRPTICSVYVYLLNRASINNVSSLGYTFFEGVFEVIRKDTKKIFIKAISQITGILNVSIFR